jgi:hypothetical protein
MLNIFKSLQTSKNTLSTLSIYPRIISVYFYRILSTNHPSSLFPQPTYEKCQSAHNEQKKNFIWSKSNFNFLKLSKFSYFQKGPILLVYITIASILIEIYSFSPSDYCGVYINLHYQSFINRSGQIHRT